MTGFHETRFPLDLALGARGGPMRRTEIVISATGREERNARWADSRRKYDAGYGVKTIAKLNEIVAFFEERRGRLYGFRFRDRLDWTSGLRNAAPDFTDQEIGIGDGVRRDFPLIKTYGETFAPYRREITKPVAGTVSIGVGGIEKATADFTCNVTDGVVRFNVAPVTGALITAGYAFDVPVRFDTDMLDIDLLAFEAGAIPSIPLIEIRV